MVGEAGSDTTVVTSGVPRSSVLGPLLPLLFTNDLATTLQSPIFFFADNVEVVGPSRRDALARAKTWDLKLKAGKSHLLSRTAEGDTTAVSEVIDLGI